MKSGLREITKVKPNSTRLAATAKGSHSFFTIAQPAIIKLEGT
jgi:hypothetical protein